MKAITFSISAVKGTDMAAGCHLQTSVVSGNEVMRVDALCGYGFWHYRLPFSCLLNLLLLTILGGSDPGLKVNYVLKLLKIGKYPDIMQK